MLQSLHLRNVGPAPEMKLEFAPRLNLITGDNGLGKSFLLDVAWWALTRKWPHDLNPELTSGYRAQPRDPKAKATIELGLTSKTRPILYESTYSPRDEAWTGKAGRPWNPGLVLYAHSDGAFSVWDPARNYWKKRGNVDVQERLPAYVFSPKEVWDGLEVEIEGKKTVVSNGLIRDWASWIKEGGADAENMAGALRTLSPSEDSRDVLTPGPLTRLGIGDVRDMPSLKTGYSDAVPIVHASAGVRRVTALAYMLLWSWREHWIAAEQLGEDRTTQVVMLIDELESHLHPRWQRSILNGLLRVVRAMHENATIQLISTTHSPMLLASAEPLFEEDEDAWFDLDFEPRDGRGEVVLRVRPFVRHGEVSNWLTSEAFDLRQARSLEAEQAIERARGLLARGTPSPTPEEVTEVDAALRAARLPELDPFWVRWSAFAKDVQAGADRK